MVKPIRYVHNRNPWKMFDSNRPRRRSGRCGWALRRVIFTLVAIRTAMNLMSLHTSQDTSLDLLQPTTTGNYEWSSHSRESIADPIDWTSPGKYALWTYPIQPPSMMEIEDAEIVICAYQTCREFVKARNGQVRSLNLPSILSKADGLSPDQAANFRQFLEDQYWYKIQYQQDFPHHVQSVSFLSLAAIKHGRHSDFCIRPLGFTDRHCGNNIIVNPDYDPTSTALSSKVRPPYWIEGLDFNATRFGVLSYDRRVATVKVANSGDELQTFPGIQFLPYVTDFVDRDFGLPGTRAHYFFANAWWGYPSKFPPASNATPAFISVHMSGKFQKITVPEHLNYFEQYTSHVGPIGARDEPTLAFLKSLELPTYQSSCFTQMLRPNGNKYHETVRQRHLIMLVDVDLDLLPPDVAQQGEVFSANVNRSLIFQRDARLQHAQELYYAYSNLAKVVITSRIHSALPASVNGVPVIFVEREEKDMPGGRGGRTQGISDLFHVFRPESGDKWNFDLDRMPPNPGVHRQDRYRASFWNYMKQRLPSWYMDTAHLFGLIPLRRLGQGVPSTSHHGDLHDLFHFIFTTPPETLTWRVQRAIEAIFYHHPNAKVILHSCTIPTQGSRLDRFIEVGYDLEIRSYSLATLLDSSLVISEGDRRQILKFFQSSLKGDFWYSHETDLIRLLILEKYGGVYLDTDVHIIRPFPKSLRNVLAYQDRLTLKRALKLALVRKVNGAVMIFEKGNTFLQDLVIEAVNRLLHNYNPNTWGILGPDLLSDVWRAHYESRQLGENLGVEVLESTAFYPYNFGNAHECFQEDQKSFFTASAISEETYAVHLNSKVTGRFQSTRKGSYCDTMFHKFCIFCDEIYTSPTQPSKFFFF